MTIQDRIQAVVEFGFTERQARFLVLVMRHAGVCVPRQYARFASVAYGAKCNAFFERLVRRGCARRNDCIHNRARLYHVHHKSLYHAIGEATSRFRRPVSPRLAIERLMLLDAVIATPDLDWLTTASEKVAHLAKLTASGGAAAPKGPSEAVSRPAVELPGAFPIGLAPDGRTILLYLATEPWTDSFRSFLQGHAALLRVATHWTLRLVFPRPLDRVYNAYQTVIREELESPLQPATISELKWYFENRDKATKEPLNPQTQAFLSVGAKAFATPRFNELYRRWLKDGNAVFAGPSSPAIAEALNTGRGRVECIALAHTYRHLSPLVDQTRSTRHGVENGVEKAAPRGDIKSARPQPPPSTPQSRSERSVLM
jgi:hypothetical protein